MTDEDREFMLSIKEAQEYHYKEIRKGIQLIIFLLFIGLVAICFQ